MRPKSRTKTALRMMMTAFPMGGVIWASFLPLTTWLHQALVLIVLVWFYVFYLLDCLYLAG